MAKLMELTPKMKAYVMKRGWLRNPANGMCMVATEILVRRPDLQWVSGPDPDAKELEPRVHISHAELDGGTALVTPGEEVHIGGEKAINALDEVLERLAMASKKAELRSIGIELGLSLDVKKTNTQMREEIQEHVEKLRSFEI